MNTNDRPLIKLSALSPAPLASKTSFSKSLLSLLSFPIAHRPTVQGFGGPYAVHSLSPSFGLQVVPYNTHPQSFFVVVLYSTVLYFPGRTIPNKRVFLLSRSVDNLAPSSPSPYPQSNNALSTLPESTSHTIVWEK